MEKTEGAFAKRGAGALLFAKFVPGMSLLIILALIALYIAAKYLGRRRFIRKLRIDRVTPHQARMLLESGDPITIIDLRHPAEVEREGMKIAGALVLRPDELRSRSHEIPRNQQIILYCT